MTGRGEIHERISSSLRLRPLIHLCQLVQVTEGTSLAGEDWTGTITDEVEGALVKIGNLFELGVDLASDLGSEGPWTTETVFGLRIRQEGTKRGSGMTEIEKLEDRLETRLPTVPNLGLLSVLAQYQHPLRQNTDLVQHGLRTMPGVLIATRSSGL